MCRTKECFVAYTLVHCTVLDYCNVKVYCNLRLLDEIDHIEWLSD